MTTRSATASRGRPTTRPGPSQPRQRAATQPASPPPNTTRPRSRSARSRDRLELDTDLVRPHHVSDPPDNDLRQQFDSLRQAVEGLVGVVQQLATQAATREATTPAVIAATPPDVAAPVYLLPTAPTSNTSAYMPPTGAPPPTPLAELAAPSGESNAVPVVLEQHTQRPILFAAGLPAGYHISEKLKVRIWTHKYIDFNDITSNASNTSTYTMSLIDNGTPTLNFAPQRKRPLTETECSTAWDDFLAVYTQKHPHHLTDLITYSRCRRERIGGNTITSSGWTGSTACAPGLQSVSTCSWPPHSDAHNSPFGPPSLHDQCNIDHNHNHPDPLQATASHSTPRTSGVRCRTAPLNIPAPNAKGSNQCTGHVTHDNTQPHRVEHTDLPTPIHTQTLNEWLIGYPHREKVVAIFKDGAHLEYDGDHAPLTSHNSTSATSQPNVINTKIEQELAMDRFAGPFNKPPMSNFKSSPLALREKHDTGKFRLLHNLSYPYDHNSVNANIPKSATQVTYESLSDAIVAIQDKSPNPYMAKTDIADAFRLVPLHPADYHLTGFQWQNKFYYDRCLPQGSASSCHIFETISTALKWILQNKLQVGTVVKVLDDFLFIANTK